MNVLISMIILVDGMFLLKLFCFSFIYVKTLGGGLAHRSKQCCEETFG